MLILEKISRHEWVIIMLKVKFIELIENEINCCRLRRSRFIDGLILYPLRITTTFQLTQQVQECFFTILNLLAPVQ